jgi:hypothetical protein
LQEDGCDREFGELTFGRCQASGRRWLGHGSLDLVRGVCSRTGGSRRIRMGGAEPFPAEDGLSRRRSRREFVCRCRAVRLGEDSRCPVDGWAG